MTESRRRALTEPYAAVRDRPDLADTRTAGTQQGGNRVPAAGQNRRGSAGDCGVAVVRFLKVTLTVPPPTILLITVKSITPSPALLGPVSALSRLKGTGPVRVSVLPAANPNQDVYRPETENRLRHRRRLIQYPTGSA